MVTNSITAAQRRSNTLCARGHKDIRYAVTTVLAGIPPLDLTVEKRSIRHRYKKKYFPVIWNRLEPFVIHRTLPLKALDYMLEMRVLEAWDRVYRESVPEGHWCWTLIPSVTAEGMELVQRPNFLLSQAISGHGAFKAYLYRIGKRTSPLCRCGAHDQTPQHVFQECNLYAEGRPLDWSNGLIEDLRHYLIETTRRLWQEEKEEVRTGINCTRRGSHHRGRRTGAPIRGAGPAPASR